MSGSEAEQLVEELRKARVEDFVVHTCSLFASIAFGKLADEARDLDQARLAIEALRALQPLAPEEARGDLQQVIANLQLAFAAAASQTGSDPQGKGSDPAGSDPEEAKGSDPAGSDPGGDAAA